MFFGYSVFGNPFYDMMMQRFEDSVTLGTHYFATTKDIKKAYRLIVRDFHPDANNGDDTNAIKFRDATEAYDRMKTFNETFPMMDMLETNDLTKVLADTQSQFFIANVTMLNIIMNSATAPSKRPRNSRVELLENMCMEKR